MAWWTLELRIDKEQSMAKGYEDQLCCSFCGKKQVQVQKLIAGNKKDVYICDECVEI